MTLNIVAMVWLYKVLYLKKEVVVPLKAYSMTSYESFQKSNRLLELINMRYRIQTHLNNRFKLGDIIATMLTWLVISALIASKLHVYPGLKAIIFISLSIVPVVLLEWRLEKIEQSIDQSLFSFLSLINASLLKTEDIIQTLIEVETELDNPSIQNNIKMFSRSIKAGISSELAFQRLTEGVSHDYLKYVYLNIEQSHEKNGDAMELMQALEDEYTSIQIEFNKRKIELKHDRNLTIFSLLIVLLTALKIVKSNDYITQFYSNTEFGQIMGVVLAFGMLTGIFMVLMASKMRH